MHLKVLSVLNDGQNLSGGTEDLNHVDRLRDMLGDVSKRGISWHTEQFSGRRIHWYDNVSLLLQVTGHLVSVFGGILRNSNRRYGLCGTKDLAGEPYCLAGTQDSSSPALILLIRT